MVAFCIHIVNICIHTKDENKRVLQINHMEGYENKVKGDGKDLGLDQCKKGSCYLN